MIDFRYHLVSIVSIFLALAVGIVLGAGPLQGRLGESLNSQVQDLSKRKSELDAELLAAKRDAGVRDQFEAATVTALTRDRLTGYSVALVVLPGTEAGLVRSARTTLHQAGATVVSETSLKGEWTSSGAAEERAKIQPEVAAALGVDPASLSKTSGLDSLLGTALLHPKGAKPNLSAEQLGSAMGLLAGAGLLDIDTPAQTTADALVIVSAPVVESDEQVRATIAGRWAALARTLDSATTGSVVAGATSDFPTEATSGSLSVVRAIRDSSAVEQVSTVDDLDQPMGRSSLIFALLEQFAGKSGQYGTGPAAGTPFAAPVP